MNADQKHKNQNVVVGGIQLNTQAVNPLAASAVGVWADSAGQMRVQGTNGASNAIYWESPKPHAANAAVTGSGAVNLSFQRVSIPAHMTATQLDILAHLTVVASTHFSGTLNVAAYTFAGAGTDASAGRASSAAFAQSIDSSVYTNHSGTRYRSMALASWNLTPGEYLFAFHANNNGPAGTTGSYTFYGQSGISVAGVQGAAANHTAYWGPGLYSAATAAFPATLVRSDIAQTGALALAQPHFRIAGVSA
jgi:hypothetical protein